MCISRLLYFNATQWERHSFWKKCSHTTSKRVNSNKFSLGIGHPNLLEAKCPSSTQSTLSSWWYSSLTTLWLTTQNHAYSIFEYSHHFWTQCTCWQVIVAINHAKISTLVILFLAALHLNFKLQTITRPTTTTTTITACNTPYRVVTRSKLTKVRLPIWEKQSKTVWSAFCDLPSWDDPLYSTECCDVLWTQSVGVEIKLPTQGCMAN